MVVKYCDACKNPVMIHFIASIAFIFGCSVVIYLTPKSLLLSLKKRVIDTVDGRKAHTVAASRLGDIRFLPAIFLSVFVCL